MSNNNEKKQRPTNDTTYNTTTTTHRCCVPYGKKNGGGREKPTRSEATGDCIPVKTEDCIKRLRIILEGPMGIGKSSLASEMNTRSPQWRIHPEAVKSIRSKENTHPLEYKEAVSIFRSFNRLTDSPFYRPSSYLEILGATAREFNTESSCLKGVHSTNSSFRDTSSTAQRLVLQENINLREEFIDDETNTHVFERSPESAYLVFSDGQELRKDLHKLLKESRCFTNTEEQRVFIVLYVESDLAASSLFRLIGNRIRETRDERLKAMSLKEHSLDDSDEYITQYYLNCINGRYRSWGTSFDSILKYSMNKLPHRNDHCIPVKCDDVVCSYANGAIGRQEYIRALWKKCVVPALMKNKRQCCCPTLTLICAKILKETNTADDEECRRGVTRKRT